MCEESGVASARSAISGTRRACASTICGMGDERSSSASMQLKSRKRKDTSPICSAMRVKKRDLSEAESAVAEATATLYEGRPDIVALALRNPPGI